MTTFTILLKNCYDFQIAFTTKLFLNSSITQNLLNISNLSLHSLKRHYDVFHVLNIRNIFKRYKYWKISFKSKSLEFETI
jgi:hypothetical protein